MAGGRRQEAGGGPGFTLRRALPLTLTPPSIAAPKPATPWPIMSSHSQCRAFVALVAASILHFAFGCIDDKGPSLTCSIVVIVMLSIHLMRRGGIGEGLKECVAWRGRNGRA